MKTQIKRFSKSTLAVILSVCMLVSCLTVGIIATDAAVVSDSGAIAAKVNDETVGDSKGENHEFRFDKLYVDASVCSNFNTGGFAYSFTANSTDWGTWVSQSAVDCGNGVYSFDLSNISSYDWIRTFRINSKTGNSSASDSSALMTPPNYNTINNCIVLDSDGNGTWGTFVPSNSTYYVRGSAGGLNWNSGSAMSVAGTIRYKQVTAATEFKIVTPDGWVDDSNHGVEFTSYDNSHSGANLTLSTANNNVKIPSAGFICFDTATNKIYARSTTPAATTYTSISASAQGTTDGTNYSALSGANASVSAASYSTGDAALTLSANEVSGYTFAQWKVTSGSGTLTNENSINGATFIPSASDTVVTAQYKKNYTITIGDNEAGEGTGTVTSSTATVKAGDSYTITLTPDVYSYPDTLKINNTSVNITKDKNTGVGTYTGTATGNVTAIGRFTTRYEVRGTNLTGITWDSGVKMTPNRDGTYTATFTAQPENEYTFKVYNVASDSWHGYTNKLTLDGAFDDGGTSSTCLGVDDGYGNKNVKLTLSEACNVTIVYTADTSTNAITKVILDPVNGETYAITVGSPADAVLTATYRNTTYNEGETINVRAGQQITFSATTEPSKYVSGYTLGGTPVTSPYTVSASDNNKTLTCTVGNLLAINCVTNKKLWGTVSTSPEYAKKGDTVTITYTPASGSLKTIVVTDSSGKTVKSWKVENGSLVVDQAQATQSSMVFLSKLALTRISGNVYSFNKAGEALGASDDNETIGDSELTFIMPDSEVTVTATYDEYSAPSNWYYNGYDTSGNQVSGYYDQQMTETKLNGVEYSYFNVSGRTEGHEQLFTVKNSDSSSGTSKFYVETPAIDDWNNSDPYIHWNDDNWNDGSTFHKLTYKETKEKNDNLEKKLWYTTEVHAGVGCVITNGKSGDAWKQTTDITAEAVAFGAVWIRSDMSDNKFNWDRYSQSDLPSDAGSSSSTEYFYTTDGGATKGNYTTALGFNNTFQEYGATKDDVYKKYARPNTDSTDYYILVFYPGKSYSYNGQILDLTSATVPTIVWSETLPGGSVTKVDTVGKVYAKDGAVRHGYQRFAECGETYITKVTGADGTVYATTGSGTVYAKNHARGGKDGNVDWDYIANIPVGSTIEWTTTLGEGLYDGTNQFKDSHYVRGFSVNGVTEEVFDWNSNGTYSSKHVVTDIDAERGHIEITPVYWLKDATYTKTFYIEGFDRDDTQFKNNSWGDELGIYPYYSGINGTDNAFGGYPGQPMIFYKGTYVQQIPTTVNGLSTGAKVIGMTMGNNYWDLLHRELNANDPVYKIAEHRQTYDFDDFYEISNEKSPLAITFSFRYRNQKTDNFDDGPDDRNNLAVHYDTVKLSDYKNDTINHSGTEEYLDAINRKIDLFGNVLTTAQESKTPLLVITNGYKNTYVGKYATEWAVYEQQSDDTYKYITSISPSALAVNNSSNLSAYNASAYKTAYETLEAYKGYPVLISFEKAQTNKVDDVANRLDGRWYYTKSSDQVVGNIVIQYDDGSGYTNDSFNEGTHVGSHTNASAYFTNTTPSDFYGEVTSPKIQLTAATQYFNLKAEESTGYQFVGWYQYQDGQYIPIEQDEGITETHSIIKKTETFYARFKKYTSGSLTVKHIIENNDTYKGTGTPYLTAQILSPDETVVANFNRQTGANFVNSKYISTLNPNYKVRLTIDTTPEQDNNFEEYSLLLTTAEGQTASVATFFGDAKQSGNLNRASGNTDGSAVVFEFSVSDLFSSNDQTVTGLTYVSHLKKTEYTFDYEINYTFPTRIWNDQTYQVTGKISSDRVSSYVNLEDTKTESTLKTSLLETLTPYESNFQQVIVWDYNNAEQTCVSQSDTNFKITAKVTATAASSNTVHAEFRLPYEFNKADKNYSAVEYDFYDAAPTYTTSRTEEYYQKLYTANPPSVNEYGGLVPADSDGNKTEVKGVGYDDSIGTVTLTSQESRVFNTDNSITTERDKMYPVTAPDYIYYSNSGANVKYHTNRQAAYYFSYDDAKYHYGYKDFNDGIVAEGLVKKYFTRWDVYVDGKLITSCYSKEFNLTAYQDIVVVPVFESEKPTDRIDEVTNQGVKTSITFLGTTRNQWNVEGIEDSQVTVKKGSETYNITAADRLFTDFDIEFADGRNVFREIDGDVKGNNKYELGVVIQQLGDLEAAANGYDTNASTYAAKYADQYNENDLVNWINGTSTNKPDGFTSIKSVLGTNYSDNKNFYKDHKLLSNKNSAEYYYYFTKSRSLSDNSSKEYQDHTKAYRAFSYIKVGVYNSDTGQYDFTTQVSSSPVYFTTYDEAVRTK